MDSSRWAIATLLLSCAGVLADLPVVINTWPFTNATAKAWQVLSGGGSPLDAVTQGCAACEILRCDGTVGYGGSPDEAGETTLDAMVMDGSSMDVGAVAGLRRIKNAVGVARAVLEHTEHTLLVGDAATRFAVSMGFREESLTTPESAKMHTDWLSSRCQPNYWKNVVPDPRQNCGPYKPAGQMASEAYASHASSAIGPGNHDTIAMVAIGADGTVAAGTSTNGLRNKIPGRVGDSPMPGAGAYADTEIGGCGATGDGDVMLRFLPCYQAVQNLRAGMSPKAAAEDALRRVIRRHPSFQGAIAVVDKHGRHGAACHGWTFGYSIAGKETGGRVQVVTVQPI